VDALRDPARRMLDRNSLPHNHLHLWNLKESSLFADLADYLTSDKLFLKPKNFPHQDQRYQCVLCYPEDCANAELDIHVTLSPKGVPPWVKIAVHKSDTVQTLPRIHVIPKTDENQTKEP
jgi:hypothetical protein